MISREDCIEIGKVIKTHHLQGQVVILSEDNLLENYAEEPVFILLDGAPVPFFIAEEGLSPRNHNSYIVKFDFVDSLHRAERLVGCEVLAEKKILSENLPQEEKEYNIFDLNGFTLIDENSGESGKITDVADYSGNVVLSVVIFGKEILLPLAEKYIRGIDFEQQEILADIPQDIVDLY